MHFSHPVCLQMVRSSKKPAHTITQLVLSATRTNWSQYKRCLWWIVNSGDNKDGTTWGHYSGLWRNQKAREYRRPGAPVCREAATGSHRQGAQSLKTRQKNRLVREHKQKNGKKQARQKRQANYRARHHLTPDTGSLSGSRFLWRRHEPEEGGVGSYFQKPETSPERHGILLKKKTQKDYIFKVKLRGLLKLSLTIPSNCCDWKEPNIGPRCFDRSPICSHQMLNTEINLNITWKIDWGQIAARLPRPSKNPDFPKKIRRSAIGSWTILQTPWKTSQCILKRHIFVIC